jgi:glycosyltransferase involved in cell wall biosynthesis
MKTSYFSIILPTRNRPELALRVIKHTLKQTFANYELVIIDNATDDGNKLDLSDVNDPRIKYLRTGNLTMQDNWQFGFDNSEGEYIFMIEDKLLLNINLLERAQKIIQDEHADILTWGTATCKTEFDAELFNTANATWSKISAEAVIADGLNCEIESYHKIAPRCLNSVFSRKSAEKAQSRVGRLFRTVSPDYSCGAITLAFSTYIINIHANLAFVLPGASNGEQSATDAEAALKFMESSGVEIGKFFSIVPIKWPVINNIIYADLLHFWISTGTIQNVEINKGNYIAMLLKEIIFRRKRGIQTSNYIKEIRYYFSSFKGIDKLNIFIHLCKKFRSGWPNRFSGMRKNGLDFIFVMRVLVGFK